MLWQRCGCWWLESGPEGTDVCDDIDRKLMDLLHLVNKCIFSSFAVAIPVPILYFFLPAQESPITLERPEMEHVT